jgi:hypothetical protein
MTGFRCYVQTASWAKVTAASHASNNAISGCVSDQEAYQ